MKDTFAVGHIALGYLTGKASAKLLNVKMNIPLVLTLSILPDVDLLLTPMLQHGGPTHSVILYLAMAFPAFLVWKNQTIPYLVALASHPLLGDYLTRPSKGLGVQLFFPLTSTWYAAGLEATSVMFAYLEWMLFTLFIALVLKTKDVTTLVKPHPSNMLLAMPISTALLPVFIQFPIPVPPELIFPHLILIAILAPSVLIDIKHIMRRHHHF